MEALQKAIEKIKEQQSKESPYSPVRVLGNQLIGMLMSFPEAAQVVLTDLEGTGMSIQCCEAKIREKANEIQKKERGKGVAISLEEAAKVIADFYGITDIVEPYLNSPEYELPTPKQFVQVQPESENKPQKRKLLNLADFM